FCSRRRITRFDCDWSSDVCSSDLRSGFGLPAYPRADNPNPDRVTSLVLCQVSRGAARRTARASAADRRRLRLTAVEGGVELGERSEERRVEKESRYRWSGER